MLVAIYYAYRIPDFRAPILRTPLIAAFCSIPYLALFGLSGQALINAWWAANVIVLVLGVRPRRAISGEGVGRGHGTRAWDKGGGGPQLSDGVRLLRMTRNSI